MFSVIASSARVSSPSASCSKSGHHHQSHPMNSEMEHNYEVGNAKNIQDKERETFLSYGIFNMVAGKRTAELLHKQHKHELHRQSHSDVYKLSDLFHHHKHSNESTPNPSPKLKHQRPTHAHTIDLTEHLMANASSKTHGHGNHHHKGSKSDLSKSSESQKHKKPSDLQPSHSMDSILHKSGVSCHKPHKWSPWSVVLRGVSSRQVVNLQHYFCWIREREKEMGFFWYLGSRYKYTFAHDVCCKLYISFSGAKTDIMEVNLGIKNKTLQHSVSSSSVYMCLLYFLLLCFVFLHLINVLYRIIKKHAFEFC